jgi:hypothetical protein
MLWAVAAGLIGFSITSANAKCVDYPYSITGRVVDSAGNPVPSAQLQLSWRDYIQSHELRSVAKIDGTFEIHIRVNAYSGSGIFAADLCEFSLQSAAVAAAAPQFQPSRASVTFSSRRAANVVVALEAARG